MHFVSDEENAVLAANVLQQLEVAARRNDEAAFAKNRFGDDGGDGFRSDDTLEGVFEVVRESFGGGTFFAAIRISERNAVNVAGERREAGFIRMRFARESHCEERAAVEGVFETNDGRTLGVGARDLDGVFDGLGSGVHEDGFLREIARGKRVEFFRDGHVALIGSDGETEMQVFLELLADRGEHARRAMANIEAANAASEIEIAIAVDVLDDGAFGARGENRRGV